MNTIKIMQAFVRRSCWRLPKHRASYCSSTQTLKTAAPPPQLILEQLGNRSLILIEGEETVPFLQGLITNDITHLQDPLRSSEAGVTSLYTMFLNKAGRVLYDSIIYKTNDPKAFMIECDEQVSKALCRHLKIYRVRRKINIEPMDQTWKPWVLFSQNADEQNSLDVSFPKFSEMATVDPRLAELGIRFLFASEKNYDDIEKTIKGLKAELNIAAPTPKNSYRYHRYRLGVGEGVQDFPLEKCFPLEINADFLNGVSFNKGCYIGQELTARVHHTGVVRKRIMPLQLSVANAEEVSVVKNEADANVGTIRGTCEDRALGLLRVEQVLKATKLMASGHECHVEKPYWWPSLSSKTVANEAN